MGSRGGNVVVVSWRRILGALVVAAPLFFLGLAMDERILAVTGLVVAVATLLVEVRALISELGRAPVISEGEHLDKLREALRGEWRDEAEARRLRDPRLLPLSWRQTERAVMESPEAILGGDPPEGARLRLDGEVAGDLDLASRKLADEFSKLPRGRLVILGEPGAGKSVLALMLTLGLLERPDSYGRVPVLLSLSSWDPVSQSLDDWLATGVAAHIGGNLAVPEMLIRRNLLIPILDGLDEIPEERRRTAIRAVNEAIRSARPVVVTCRSTEYEDLIEGGAPRLRRAPVIEVQPLSAADVSTYLREVEWPDGTTWAAVCDRMRDSQELPVSQALSTPLIVSVARTVYQQLGGDPGELLGPDFASRHDVEDYLTDRLVEAAYAWSPQQSEPRPRWSADQARRWLTFLARYLHEHRDRDFAWWLLGPRTLSPWFGPLLGIGGGVLLMISVAAWVRLLGHEAGPGLQDTIVLGAGTGGAFAVLTTLVWYAASGRAPGRLSLATSGSARRFRRGFRTGLTAALIPVTTGLCGLGAVFTITQAWQLRNIQLFIQGLWVVGALSVLVGCSLAVHSWLEAPPRGAARTSPADSLRQDRRSAWWGTLAAGATVGALAVPVLVLGAVSGGLTGRLASAWAGWPGDAQLWRLARHDTSQITLGIFRSWSLLAGGAVLLPAVFVASLVFLSRAWPRYVLARLTLTLGGRLPWNLPGFLADARSRNLLRQSGAVYQFRHIRLQEHLANHAVGGARSDGGLLRSRPAVRRARWVAGAAASVVVLGLLGAIPADSSRLTIAAPQGSRPVELDVSSDGRLAAAMSRRDNAVRLWDLSTGELRAKLKPPRSRVRYHWFSEDGGYLFVNAGGRFEEDIDGETTGWRTDTLQQVVAQAVDVEALGGGRVLRIDRKDTAPDAPYDRKTELWDAASGRVFYRDGETLLVAHDTTRFVTVGPANRLSLWDAVTGRKVRDLSEFAGSAATGSVELSHGLVSSNDGAAAQLWAADDGHHVITDAGPGSAFGFDPAAGTLLRIRGRQERRGHRGQVVIWNRRTGRQIAQLPEASYSSNGSGPCNGWCSFSPDGRWIVVSILTGEDSFDESSRSLVVDAATGSIAHETTGQVSFAPPGRGGVRNTALVLSSSVEDEPVPRATLEAWDLTTRTRSFALTTFAHRFAWSTMSTQSGSLPGLETGTVLLGGGDRPLELVNVSTGRPVRVLDPRGERSFGVFAPGHRVLLTVRGDVLELWETATGRRLGELDGAGDAVSPIDDMSGDSGRPLEEAYGAGVAGSDPDLFGPPKTMRQLSPGGDFFFSRDGRHLATVSAGSDVVKLWDTSSAELLRTLVGHTGPIRELGFLPDRRTVVTVGRSDDTIRLWDLPAGAHG